jgi:hypothetical protein
VATPYRKQILDHVVTSLTAITTGAGYKTTAVTVTRRMLGPDEVPVDATPWFGAVPVGVERALYQPVGIMDMILPVVVVGADVVSTQTDDARGTSAANLLDDIKYALCGTVDLSRRGGLAVSTTIVEQWSDEAHEVPVVLDHGRVLAYVVVRAEVRYSQQRSHS